MASQITQTIKEFFAHHRKFTPFQKVLISSVFVGVVFCLFRNWWYLSVSCTYAVTLYASLQCTKYIINSNSYFPSDAILEFCEYVIETCGNLRNTFKEKNLDSNTKVEGGESSSRHGEKCSLQIHTNESSKKDYDMCESAEFPEVPVISNSALYCEKTLVCAPPNESEISKEINSIIRLIQQDFIESWYKLFSTEQSVLNESEVIFHHIVHALQGRLYRADTKKIFEFILRMFKEHVQYVKEAQRLYQVQSKIRRRKSIAKLLNQGTGKIQSSPSKVSIIYKSIEECYGSKVELHPAVTNIEAEHAYQKSVTELLLFHLLREDMHDTVALMCALKEILTFNVLQKVMDLISATTFLHERIIKITSDEEICAGLESIPSITVSESEFLTSDVQSILTQRKNSKTEIDAICETHSSLSEKSPQKELPPERETILNDTDSHVVKWKEDTEIHTVSKGMCNECNRLCSADKDRISPRPHTCSLGTTPAFFDVNLDPERVSLTSFASVSSTSSKGSATFSLGEEGDITDSRLTRSSEKDLDSLNETERNSPVHFNDQSQKKLSAPVRNIELSTSAEVAAGGKSVESPSPIENKSPTNIFPSFKFPFANPLPSFPNFRKPKFFTLSPSSETVSSSSACEEQNKSDIKRSLSQGDVNPLADENVWPTRSVFQKVRITTTETAKEVGSFGEYTLYNVEFEALYQSNDGELVNKVGVVKRRFREFVNLQSRLEDNAGYRKSLKDVKGPKRILPSLPFGNMGKDTVDSRKELLESFLVGLIGKEDICNGEELKQFLGYSGDGHIAFVRKTPENTGPRIDQRLVKTMSGVFDKIVEGLPSLPQQLPRIISPFDQHEEKDDLTDVELTNDADDLDLIFEHDLDMVSKEKIESAFEKFVEQQSVCVFDDEVEHNTTLVTHDIWPNLLMVDFDRRNILLKIILYINIRDQCTHLAGPEESGNQF